MNGGKRDRYKEKKDNEGRREMVEGGERQGEELHPCVRDIDIILHIFPRYIAELEEEHPLTPNQICKQI